MKTVFIFVLAIVVISMQGCGQGILTETTEITKTNKQTGEKKIQKTQRIFKVNTFCKDLDLTNLNLPSGLKAKKIKSKSQNIKVITPTLAVETEGGE